MNSDEDLYIVAPAYNEEENIETFLDEWYPIVQEKSELSRLVLLDDGSSDDTFSVSQSFANSKSKLIVKTRENQGHGASCMDLYQYAVSEGADWVLQIDSDNQVTADDFDQLWNQRHQTSFIFGNRKNREDGWHRSLASFFLSGVLLVITGNYIKDPNVPFRLMRADELEDLLPLLPDDFFLVNSLLSAVAADEGIDIRFVNVEFQAREHGNSLYGASSLIKKGFHATIFFIKYFWLSLDDGYSYTDNS